MPEATQQAKLFESGRDLPEGMRHLLGLISAGKQRAAAVFFFGGFYRVAANEPDLRVVRLVARKTSQRPLLAAPTSLLPRISMI